MHLFNFQIWLLSQCASGGGFKYTSHFRNSPCGNAIFPSLDLRFQVLVIMFDSNALKVSFDTVGDSLSKVSRLSSLKPRAAKRAFSLTLYQFVSPSKPNELKYVFDLDFPLFRKYCYLPTFQVLSSLPLHNGGCLYQLPQFYFFLFFCCLFVFNIFLIELLTTSLSWALLTSELKPTTT